MIVRAGAGAEPGLQLASPRDGAERGSQVSFSHPHGYAIMQALIHEVRFHSISIQFQFNFSSIFNSISSSYLWPGGHRRLSRAGYHPVRSHSLAGILPSTGGFERPFALRAGLASRRCILSSRTCGRRWTCCTASSAPARGTRRRSNSQSPPVFRRFSANSRHCVPTFHHFDVKFLWPDAQAAARDVTRKP